MAKLIDLPPLEREHWKLHLLAVRKDTPSLGREVRAYLRDAELPKIKHPGYVHDWLEQPDKRAEIEKYG